VHLKVTSEQFIYMSFGSEVVITRSNRMKERVKAMAGLAILQNKSMSHHLQLPMLCGFVGSQ